MITKSIYNDVELEVEVCTETKVTSSIGKFSNTSIKIHEVKIAGDKIEEGLACLSEACGYNLTAKQMLEIVFKNDNLIGWVATSEGLIYDVINNEEVVATMCSLAQDLVDDVIG